MKFVQAVLTTSLIAIFSSLSAQKIGVGTTTNTTNTQTNTGGGKVLPGTGGSQTNTSTGGSTKGSGNGVVDIIENVVGGSSNFTQGEAASAIKEALSAGVNIGVNKASATDGFFKNQMIKIMFPKEAQVAENTLRQIGLSSLTDNFVKSMNRAAEGASKQAAPIFLNSIKQMTITDAINIVSNQQPDAATQFLQRTTTEPLVTSFKPSIKTALDKTLATKYWGDITSRYNKIPFVKKVNTDLPDYVTRKAVTGLFYLIGQEEAKIRKDPASRTTDILKKVFGKK